MRGCPRGSSLASHHHRPASTAPSTAKTWKTWCQPNVVMIQTTSGVPTTLPMYSPQSSSELALDCSRLGNQRCRVYTEAGQSAAWPTPSTALISTNPRNTTPYGVTKVNTDHHS